MTPIALSIGWYVGWPVGLVVVGLVVVLLLTLIGQARQVTGQAVDIERALDGARVNTDALWDVRQTNATVGRVTRGLAAAREMLAR